ncbi:hypothetical protein [Catenuloplanes indicus]|uniref:Uncharacterized protein n=1 Tax=Catenuloplanes indicus TaxID=137267 RepID=A0AAE3W5R5_9ACTN|nr:hypothetical protein [Catenuloplanes indicus]MDQ0369971.1 hypothetical protein [Catenuloplanes indicus]
MPDIHCRDGILLPLPEGRAYWHPGPTMATLDLRALEAAKRALQPPGRGVIVVPASGLAHRSARAALARTLSLVDEPNDLALASVPGEHVDPAVWSHLVTESGVQAYLPVAAEATRDERYVWAGSDGRAADGEPVAMLLLPPTDVAARELLRTAARLAADITRAPLERVRELDASPSTAHQFAVGMVLTGAAGIWDPARLVPPTVDEVWSRFGSDGPVPDDLLAALLDSPGSAALIRTPGPGGDQLAWLVSDGSTVWTPGPELTPAPPHLLARATAPGTSVAFIPGLTVDSRLSAAMAGLPPWDSRTPDCADRVEQLLRAIAAPGLARPAVADDIRRPRDRVAELLDGWFSPAGSFDGWDDMTIAGVTAVWLEPLPEGMLTREDAAAHMVAVERSGEDRYLLYETQNKTVTSLTLRELQRAMSGIVHVVTDAEGRLRQLDVASGARVAGAQGTATVSHTVDALLDPHSAVSRQPGYAGFELETMVRLGPALPAGAKPIFAQEVVATIASLGLRIDGDMAEPVQGVSGTWYAEKEQALAAGDRIVAEERWEIIEVVTAPGAASPGEIRTVPFSASRVQTLATTAIRWLQHAGRTGLTLRQALVPDSAGLEALDGWAAAAPSARQRADARTLREALLTPGNVTLDPRKETPRRSLPAGFEDTPLFFPDKVASATVHMQATLGNDLIAEATTQELIQRESAGRHVLSPRDEPEHNYETLSYLQQDIEAAAWEIAEFYLQSLTDQPLSAEAVTWLLRSAETTALRAKIVSAVTEMFRFAYARQVATFAKNGVLQLGRQSLHEMGAELLELTDGWSGDNAHKIITLLEERLAAQMRELDPELEPGQSLFDVEEVPPSRDDESDRESHSGSDMSIPDVDESGSEGSESSGGRPAGFTGYEVILLALRGNTEAGKRHLTNFTDHATVPSDAPVGDEMRRFSREVRFIPNLRNPTQPFDQYMTLEDTATATQWVLDVLHEGTRRSRAAREWSRSQGGIKNAVQRAATMQSFPPPPARPLWRRGRESSLVPIGDAVRRGQATPRERADGLREALRLATGPVRGFIGWRLGGNVAPQVITVIRLSWESALAASNRAFAFVGSLDPAGTTAAQTETAHMRLDYAELALDRLAELVLAEEPRLAQFLPPQHKSDDELLLEAIKGLPAWDGTDPDCVDRVEQVLSRLGIAMAGAVADALRGRDRLAARMGGEFFPPASAALLSELRIGAITPVWSVEQAHMVLVYRRDAMHYALIETQESGADRLQPFTFAEQDGWLPEPLRGTIRLLGDQNAALLQADIRTRTLAVGPHGSASPGDGRTSAALIDPGTAGTEPKTMRERARPGRPDPLIETAARRGASAPGSDLFTPFGLEPAGEGTDLASAVLASARSMHPGLGLSDVAPANDPEVMASRHDVRMYVWDPDGTAHRYGRDGAPEVFLTSARGADGATVYQPLAAAAARTSATVIESAGLGPGRPSLGRPSVVGEPGAKDGATLARSVAAELREHAALEDDWDSWRPVRTTGPGLPLAALPAAGASDARRGASPDHPIELAPAPAEGDRDVPDALRDVRITVRADREGVYRPSGVSAEDIAFSGGLRVSAGLTGLPGATGTIGPVLQWDTVVPDEPPPLFTGVELARDVERPFNVDASAWKDGWAVIGGIDAGALPEQLRSRFLLRGLLAPRNGPVNPFPRGSLRNAVPVGPVRIGAQLRFAARADLLVETLDARRRSTSTVFPGAIELLLDLPTAVGMRDDFVPSGGAAAPVPGRTEALQALPGSGGASADRLRHWLQVIGRTPHDIGVSAGRIALRIPGPLFDIAIDLGVDPDALAIFGAQIRDLVNAGPADGDQLLDRLRPHGVRSRDDIVHLSDIGARLGLDESALPALTSFLHEKVPLELLLVLPDTSLAAAVEVARIRQAMVVDPARGADLLGLRHPAEVAAVAAKLGVEPRHLAGVASEIEATLGILDRSQGNELQRRLGTGGEEYRESDDAGRWGPWQRFPSGSEAHAALDARFHAQWTARGEWIAEEVSALLTVEGRATPETVSRYVTLSARLGVPVTDLGFLLPSRHVELLLHEFLADVPLEMVVEGAHWEALLGHGEPEMSSVLQRGLPRKDYSDAEIVEWRSRFGLDRNPELFRDFIGARWSDPEKLLTIMSRAGLNDRDLPDLVGLSVWIGWMPDWLGRTTFRMGVRTRGLFEVATSGRNLIDPAHLTAFSHLVSQAVTGDMAAASNGLRPGNLATQLIEAARRWSPIRDPRHHVGWMLRQASRWSARDARGWPDVYQLGLWLSQLPLAAPDSFDQAREDLDDSVESIDMADRDAREARNEASLGALLEALADWVHAIRDETNADLTSVREAEAPPGSAAPLERGLREPLDRLRRLRDHGVRLREAADRALAEHDGADVGYALQPPSVLGMPSLDEAAERFRWAHEQAVKRTGTDSAGTPLTDGNRRYSVTVNWSLAYTRALAAYVSQVLGVLDDGERGPLSELAGRLTGVVASYARALQLLPVQRAADTLSDAEISTYLTRFDGESPGRLTAERAEHAAELWLRDRWREEFAGDGFDPDITMPELSEDFFDRPWLDPRRLAALARETARVPSLLRRLAIATDLIPGPLSELRQRTGLGKSFLIDLALRWQIDPSRLHVLNSDIGYGNSNVTAAAVREVREAAAAYGKTVPGYLDALAVTGFTHDRKPGGSLRNNARVLSALLGINLEDAAEFTDGGGDVDAAITQWEPVLADLASAFHLDRHRIAAVAAALRVPPLWVRALSIRLGEVPAQLPEAAARLGVQDGGVLFAFAARVGVRPSVFTAEDNLSRLNEEGDPAQGRFGPVERLYRSLGPDGVDQIRRRPGALPNPGWDGQGETLPAVTDSIWSVFRTQNFSGSALPRQLGVRAAESGIDVRVLAHIGSRMGMRGDNVAVAAGYFPGPPTSLLDRLTAGYRPWLSRLQQHVEFEEHELAWAHDQFRQTGGTAGLNRLAETDSHTARRIFFRSRLRDRRLIPATITGLIANHPENVNTIIREATYRNPFPAHSVPLLPDLPLRSDIEIVLSIPKEADATVVRRRASAAARSSRVDERARTVSVVPSALNDRWQGLSELIGSVFGPHSEKLPGPRMAALRIRTGFDGDAAAYLRLARLFYAHLPVLRDLGLIAPSEQSGEPSAARPGWAFFADLVADHQTSTWSMRLDLAWRSTDSVVFDLDAVGHGQIQAAAMLFGAMVDTAREPGRYPGVDDLTLPGPGERVTEQAVQKLLDLVDDAAARVQLAVLLQHDGSMPGPRPDGLLDVVSPVEVGPVHADPALHLKQVWPVTDPLHIRAAHLGAQVGLSVYELVLSLFSQHEVLPVFEGRGWTRGDALRVLLTGRIALPRDLLERAADRLDEMTAARAESLRSAFQREWAPLLHDTTLLYAPPEWSVAPGIDSSWTAPDRGVPAGFSPLEIERWVDERARGGLPSVPHTDDASVPGLVRPVTVAFDVELPVRRTGDDWTATSAARRRERMTAELAAAGVDVNVRPLAGSTDRFRIVLPGLSRTARPWHQLAHVLATLRKNAAVALPGTMAVDAQALTPGMAGAVAAFAGAHGDVLTRLGTQTPDGRVNVRADDAVVSYAGLDPSLSLGEMQALIKIVLSSVDAVTDGRAAAVRVTTDGASSVSAIGDGPLRLVRAPDAQVSELLWALFPEPDDHAQMAALFTVRTWVSDRLVLSALDTLSNWNGFDPDCVRRVAAVLAALGLPLSGSAMQLYRDRDDLAQRLGGFFRAEVDPARLMEMKIGITPVWSVTGGSQHMMLVRKRDAKHFDLIESQETGSARIQPFTFDGPRDQLPEALRGMIRLVGDLDDAIVQVDVRTGSIITGAPDSAAPSADRTVSALLDSSTAGTEPTMLRRRDRRAPERTVIIADDAVPHFSALAKRNGFIATNSLERALLPSAEKDRKRAKHLIEKALQHDPAPLRPDLVERDVQFYRVRVETVDVAFRVKQDNGPGLTVMAPLPIDDYLRDRNIEWLVESLQTAGWTVRHSDAGAPPDVEAKVITVNTQEPREATSRALWHAYALNLGLAGYADDRPFGLVQGPAALPGSDRQDASKKVRRLDDLHAQMMRPDRVRGAWLRRRLADEESFWRRQHAEARLRAAQQPDQALDRALRRDRAKAAPKMDWSGMWPQPPGFTTYPLVSATGQAGFRLYMPHLTDGTDDRPVAPERRSPETGPLIYLEFPYRAVRNGTIRETIGWLRRSLRAGSVVELRPNTQMDHNAVIDLARVLGVDHHLSIGKDMLDLRWANDSQRHFAAYGLNHRPALGPFATQYRVGPEPFDSAVHVTAPTDADARYTLGPDIEAVVADRNHLWIGKPGKSPKIAESDPRVVIGTPDAPTPWYVWQTALEWVAEFASAAGESFRLHDVRIHNPEPARVATESAVEDILVPRGTELDLFPYLLGDDLAPESLTVRDPAGRVVTGYHMLDALLDMARVSTGTTDEATIDVAVGRLAEDITGAGTMDARVRLIRLVKTTVAYAGLADITPNLLRAMQWPGFEQRFAHRAYQTASTTALELARQVTAENYAALAAGDEHAWTRVAHSLVHADALPPLEKVVLSSSASIGDGHLDVADWSLTLRRGGTVDELLASLLRGLLRAEQHVASETARVQLQRITAEQVAGIDRVRDHVLSRAGTDDPRANLFLSDGEAADWYWRNDLDRLAAELDAIRPPAPGPGGNRLRRRLTEAERAWRKMHDRLETIRQFGQHTGAEVWSRRVLRSGGSVRDWTGTTVVPPRGYQTTGLGRAGVHIHPEGTQSSITRRPPASGPLIVIEPQADEDPARLSRMLASQPEGTVIELVPAAPMTPDDAVRMATMLRTRHAVTIGRSRLHGVPDERFASYGLNHQPALGSDTDHYRITTAMPAVGRERTAVTDRDSGRYDLGSGLAAQIVGSRLWFGEPGAQPDIGPNDPEFVIGVPGRPTAWLTWQTALSWIAESAAAAGREFDPRRIRVHDPEQRPLDVPAVTDGADLYQVDEADRALFWHLFGVDPSRFADSGPGGGAIPFLLTDALADHAGVRTDTTNENVIATALDALVREAGRTPGRPGRLALLESLHTESRGKIARIAALPVQASLAQRETGPASRPNDRHVFMQDELIYGADAGGNSATSEAAFSRPTGDQDARAVHANARQRWLSVFTAAKDYLDRIGVPHAPVVLGTVSLARAELRTVGMVLGTETGELSDDALWSMIGTAVTAYGSAAARLSAALGEPSPIPAGAELFGADWDRLTVAFAVPQSRNDSGRHGDSTDSLPRSTANDLVIHSAEVVDRRDHPAGLSQPHLSPQRVMLSDVLFAAGVARTGVESLVRADRDVSRAWATLMEDLDRLSQGSELEFWMRLPELGAADTIRRVARLVPDGSHAAVRPLLALDAALRTGVFPGAFWPSSMPRLEFGSWRRQPEGILAAIRAHAARADRPVIAVDLAESTEEVAASIERLRDALRWFGRLGSAPLVVGSQATGHGTRLLEEVLTEFRPVALTVELAGSRPAWRLRDTGGGTVGDLHEAPAAEVFDAARSLSRRRSGLPTALEEWLMSHDPEPAWQYLRENWTRLNDAAVFTSLDALIEASPDDTRLPVFRTAWELARSSGMEPKIKPQPVVTQSLDVEPVWSEARGEVTAALVFDYVQEMGRSTERKDRFRWDAMLFKAFLGGKLTERQVLSMMRAVAVTGQDRASVTMMKSVMDILALPDDEELLDAKPLEHVRLKPIFDPIRGIAEGVNGSYSDCMDRYDRVSWTVNLMALKDSAPAADPFQQMRVEQLRVAAEIASNC